jgi:hypothetical protein
VSLTVDADHDYWLAIFLPTDETFNGTVGVGQASGSSRNPLTPASGSGYIAGDHTADSTIPSTTIQSHLLHAVVQALETLKPFVIS